MGRKRQLFVQPGQQFGRLMVIREVPAKPRSAECLCDCGKTHIAPIKRLSDGTTRSCGCLAQKVAAERLRTHGMANCPEHKIWKAMHRRCETPSCAHYQEYGGRGIYVCERWKSFTAFFEDVGPRPTSDHQIERIDNDGPYCPENCCWATRKEQCSNRRHNHLVEYQGKVQTIAQWSRELGVNLNALRSRFERGWTPEMAFTIPYRKRGYEITFNGKTRSTAQWAKETGLTSKLILERIDWGWPIEEVLTKPKQTIHMLTFNGRTLCIRDWCREFGINEGTLHTRLRHGWSMQEALTIPVNKRKSTTRAKKKPEL